MTRTPSHILATLTPEQRHARKKQQAREYYKRQQEKLGKEVDTTRWGKHSHMSKDEYRAFRRDYQRAWRDKQPRKEPVVRRPRAKMSDEERKERQRKAYRLKHPVKEKKTKPVLVAKVRVVKVKPVNVPKVIAPKPVKATRKVVRPVTPPKPLRKAKPPREPKPKPDVLPTLVRDESDFISVRIDAKTSLWVHRDRVEEAKANYVAKMLQGSIV